MKVRHAMLLLFVLLPLVCNAEIRLPHVLSDHAVLQRERPIHIWGWASPFDMIRVLFHEQSVETKADGFGTWEVWLKPEEAGGPFTLTISDDKNTDKLLRTDILVGDVWIASGQSNMEMPLNGFSPEVRVKDGDKEIAAANQPMLRLLIQKRRASPVALEDTDDSWMRCTPETAKQFSAVAYSFGRKIAKKEHVPIGLIDMTWGGTPAHSWISPEGIGYAGLQSVAIDGGRIAREQGHADRLRAIFAQEDAAFAEAGKPVNTRGRIPNDHGGSWTPGTLYNGMVAPYVAYAIKGVIWYQRRNRCDTRSSSKLCKGVFCTNPRLASTMGPGPISILVRADF